MIAVLLRNIERSIEVHSRLMDVCLPALRSAAKRWWQRTVQV
jgi:hypothetical protein